MTFQEITTKLPKAYYQDDSVYIIHGDCREVLPLIPDKSVDLVLTDPPYGNETDYDSYVDSEDNLRQTVNEIMPSILNKSKRSLITCGVANIQLYPKPEWILSWVTPAGSGSGKWGFCCWQPVLAYGKDPYLENGLGRRPDTIIKTEITTIKNHPCSKPIDFWQILLQRGSVRANDIVCDPFLGSGSSVEAARKLGRSVIGIDLSEKYCEIAAKRCMQSVMTLEIPKPEVEQGVLTDWQGKVLDNP